MRSDTEQLEGPLLLPGLSQTLSESFAGPRVPLDRRSLPPGSQGPGQRATIYIYNIYIYIYYVLVVFNVSSERPQHLVLEQVSFRLHLGAKTMPGAFRFKRLLSPPRFLRFSCIRARRKRLYRHVAGKRCRTHLHGVRRVSLASLDKTYRTQGNLERCQHRQDYDGRPNGACYSFTGTEHFSTVDDPSNVVLRFARTAAVLRPQLLH